MVNYPSKTGTSRVGSGNGEGNRSIPSRLVHLHPGLALGLATAQEETVAPESGNIILKTFTVKATQGVAVEEKWFYAISNTVISKCDKRSGVVISNWEADRN